MATPPMVTVSSSMGASRVIAMLGTETAPLVRTV
jgi:hypothetical protein